MTMNDTSACDPLCDCNCSLCVIFGTRCVTERSMLDMNTRYLNPSYQVTGRELAALMGLQLGYRRCEIDDADTTHRLTAHDGHRAQFICTYCGAKTMRTQAELRASFAPGADWRKPAPIVLVSA